MSEHRPVSWGTDGEVAQVPAVRVPEGARDDDTGREREPGDRGVAPDDDTGREREPGDRGVAPDDVLGRARGPRDPGVAPEDVLDRARGPRDPGVAPEDALARAPAHGGDVEAVARGLGVPVSAVLDLSASLNPFAGDLRPIVARHVEAGVLGRYPDDRAARRALAGVLDLEPTQVLLTNGGAEAIALVASVLRRGWIVEPEFSLYRRHLEQVEPGAGRWRSNPNNPTGALAGAEETAAVWDEAFYALATGSWTRGDASSGAVVLGSLTKLFACPGLRIGYVVSSDEQLMATLSERRPHWSVNALASACLPDLLDRADLRRWHTALSGARCELVEVLEHVGLVVRPSAANWVLVEAPAGLRGALLEERVLVRDCTSFGLPSTLRIAVPGAHGLERLACALERAMERCLVATPAPSDAVRLEQHAHGRHGAIPGPSHGAIPGPSHGAIPGPIPAKGPIGLQVDQLDPEGELLARGSGPVRLPTKVTVSGELLASGSGRFRGRGSGPDPAACSWTGLRGALLVCGTGSDAGKSAVVTGLCRLLARHGVRVAPFKAQNMALNSWVTDDGAEIGRAQAVQAMAAGVRAEAVMNPILLKPTGAHSSQVVVLGRPWAVHDAADYRSAREELAPVVERSLGELRARFDVVICEGAGSPAEINLLDGDFVNLGLARRAGMAAVVVGDIDRGGVFASLYGTVTLLPSELAALIGGFVINKFRGDAQLLTPGIAELTARTGVPVLGVVPWLAGMDLDAEDSLGLAAIPRGVAAFPGSPASVASGAAPVLREDGFVPSGGGAVPQVTSSQHTVDVAVVRLPHLSNATDVDAFGGDREVSVRLVEHLAELGDPDVVIVPGTKATVADLQWLRRQGLADALGARRGPRGPLIVGICGGYQMLGRTIVDNVESGAGVVDGLGWLPVETTFAWTKVTRRRRGILASADRVVVVGGYEIHHGQPRVVPDAPEVDAWFALDDEHGVEPEGVIDRTHGVLGTALHGMLEHDELRLWLLRWAATRRQVAVPSIGVPFATRREDRIDRLADALAMHLDLPRLLDLIASEAL